MKASFAIVVISAVLLQAACVTTASKTVGISGVCLFPDGRPAANVTMRMQEIGRARLLELPPIETRFESKTDDRGQFHFVVPRRGSWMIAFQEEGLMQDGFPSFGMRYALPDYARATTDLFARIQIRKPTAIEWTQQKKPNKAPEPTPLPVMPPAEPGGTPGSGVAHL